jgi:hypothetical protein
VIEYRTITLQLESGEYMQLELHPDWKITFGTPMGNRGHGAKELRIYESKEKQRACFVGVVSFWDEGLQLKRLIVGGESKPEAKRLEPSIKTTLHLGQMSTDDYEADGGEVYEDGDETAVF